MRKNKESQEIVEHLGKLNELIVHENVRPDGTRSYDLDYSNCPTMTEQHSAHLTDINYLMEKYAPDELAAYITARNQYRREILGHDFSQEPSSQDARNIVYQSRQEFNNLPEEIRNHFKSHLDFLKFIDNPANEEKMYKLGILTKKQVETLKIDEAPLHTNKPDLNPPKT